MAEKVGQLHGRSLLVRQGAKTAVEPFTQFLGGERGIKVRCRIDQRLGMLGRQWAGAAERLEATTPGDAHDPGRGTRIAPELRSLLPHDPERIVDRLIDRIAS